MQDDWPIAADRKRVRIEGRERIEQGPMDALRGVFVRLADIDNDDLAGLVNRFKLNRRGTIRNPDASESGAAVLQRGSARAA